MTYPKEFKEAISNLPPKEKDKLILRLLKNNLPLANRLLFELVHTDTVEERREKVEESLRSRISRNKENYYSVGWLNMDVRDFSGIINEHVSMTKDKFGEAHLNLIMINEVLRLNKNFILNEKQPRKKRKFCVAVIARAFKILLLIKKLDQDYFIEFEENLIQFGKHISENKDLSKEAINNGFDVNWLLNAEIPEDIVAIHKEVRAQGFLK